MRGTDAVRAACRSVFAHTVIAVKCGNVLAPACETYEKTLEACLTGRKFWIDLVLTVMSELSCVHQALQELTHGMHRSIHLIQDLVLI